MFNRFEVPEWLVWLGWTLQFGLVTLGGLALVVAWGLPAAVPLLLVSGLALLIGLAFPSWWWVLGPPAVPLALLGVILVGVLREGCGLAGCGDLILVGPPSPRSPSSCPRSQASGCGSGSGGGSGEGRTRPAPDLQSLGRARRQEAGRQRPGAASAIQSDHRPST